MESDEFLAHFGVKGMRWGVRNDSRNKIFAPTTKEERRQIRRSASAARGRKTIGNAAGAALVGVSSGIAAQKFIGKFVDVPFASIVGFTTSFATSSATFKLLESKNK